jgi:hypothetical protein
MLSQPFLFFSSSFGGWGPDNNYRGLSLRRKPPRKRYASFEKPHAISRGNRSLMYLISYAPLYVCRCNGGLGETKKKSKGAVPGLAIGQNAASHRRQKKNVREGGK